MFAGDDVLDSINTVLPPKKINAFPCQVHTASVCPLGPCKEGDEGRKNENKRRNRMRNPGRDKEKNESSFLGNQVRLSYQ